MLTSKLRSARRGIRSRAGRGCVRIVTAVVLCSPLIAGVSGLAPSAVASSQPSLLPDAGQFVAVPMYNVQPSTTVASGHSITVTVTGADGVPSNADGVVVKINTGQASQSGFFSAWDTDSGDSGTAAVGIVAGADADQSDVIPISSAGTVSFTNHSAASASMQVRVTGYYTGVGASAAGDTYVGVPWAQISGGQVAAGGSITLQVGGQGGIASGADVVVLQINAYNASQSGLLTVYTAGTTDPGYAALEYGTSVEARNLFYVKPSASGQITITNHGSGTVTVNAYTRGYFMPPTATPAGGEYWSFDPDVVYGTASGGTTLAANASATFQVGGDQDIPSTGVAQVAEDVVVTSPTANGTLQVGTPGGTMHALINFQAGDSTDVGYDQSLLTQISPSGQETITNTSSGTVNVQVAAVGYYQSPGVPSGPNSVSATVSGNSAVITWAAPSSDGGSPVTGYTVAASADSATATVDGGTYQATLTGLANAATDTFTVTATNAVGSGDAVAFSQASQTVSGTVDAPVALGATPVPVPGDTVDIYASEPPDLTDTSWTPTLLGTATTDANGHWSYTIPPYASLPADAQAAASSNGGVLNIEADAYGSATAAGTTYLETASADEPVWVGTATQSGALASTVAAPQTMTLEPFGPDHSALDTSANQCSTWASTSLAATTDTSGNACSSSASTDANVDATPPTDAYGYQEVSTESGYNPNLAADGTNLAGVPVSDPQSPHVTCGVVQKWVLNTWWQWSVIGEQHSGWDNTGKFSLGQGGEVTIGMLISADGAAYHVSGSASYTRGNSTTLDWPSSGPKQSYNDKLAMNYARLKIEHGCWLDGNKSNPYDISYKWERREWGIHNFTGGSNSDYELGTTNLYSQDDGPVNYNLQYGFNKHDISPLPPGGGLCYSTFRTRTYASGVSIAGFGVSIDTSLDASTKQCINEGKLSGPHKIWSYYGNPVQDNGSVDLKTVYSA